MSTCLSSSPETWEPYFPSKLDVHGLTNVLFVKHGVLHRPVPLPHFRPWNSLFKHNRCSCFETCFVVKQVFPLATARHPHPKRENHVFEHFCFSYFETYLFGEQVFPSPTYHSSSPETRDTLSQAKLLFMFCSLFCWCKNVPLVDLPLLLIRSAGTTCSNGIVVHVSKPVVVSEQVFPSLTWPSFFPDTREPLFQATLLFII